MQPDINKFLPMLDDFDLSDEHKINLINDLWNILSGFKDIAFGLNSIQQINDLLDHKVDADSKILLESDKSAFNQASAYSISEPN